MKTNCKSLLTIVICLCLFSVAAGAQAKILTKKHRISDVTAKTTKIVLSGNEMFDVNYMTEISRRWRISPFEFCTAEEYESLRKSSDFYFLVPVVNQRKKEAEPGIAMLCFEKGGKEEDADPAKEAIEVISIPYGPAEESTGREFVFLPAIIDIIQNYTLEAMTRDLIGYGGLASYIGKQRPNWRREIYIAESDLATSETQGNKINYLEQDEVDAIFESGEPGTLVGYTVSPVNPDNGSVCYKMLISSDTHELYFFAKHNLKNNGAGFLKADIKFISTLKK